jgi:hypothetical protein
VAKRRKPSRHGRSGDPRTRAAEDQNRTEAEATPELEDAVAAALELGHPIEIAMLASSLLAGLDLDPSQTEEPVTLPPATEFVRMFLDSGDPDLLVFAWVIARLLPDRRLQAETEVALGDDVLPDWLAPLDQAEVVSAWQTTDPLADATDIVVTVRIGDAHLSLIGLVDHNSDGALKDAFVVPVPLADVQAALGAGGRTGMQNSDLSPAVARTWLTEAIAAGEGIEPPFTSDTWPQIRPLLEWALRSCPAGGEGRPRRSWSRAEIEQIVAAFAGTAGGTVVADPVDREVLVDALHTVSRATSSDPMLLSAVRLEMGLGYLWSTALHHDLDRLLALPDTLGPYLRWAHGQRGVPADDTDESIAAIAHRRAGFSRDVTAVLDPDDD